MRITLVTRDIKEAIFEGRFQLEAVRFEGYCNTNMIIAESKDKISHPYLQFIMEHKGDMEARYSNEQRRSTARHD